MKTHLQVDARELIMETYADDSSGDSLHWWARSLIAEWKPSIDLLDLAWQLHQWFLTPEAERLGYTGEDVESFLEWWDKLGTPG